MNTVSHIAADNPRADTHDHGDGHGHGHSPHLAHHFDNLQQQFDSAKLGMWLFLATEILFFGGLFVAYAILRMRFPEVFSYASHYLDTIMGGINTCVLILSSLTMALGVRCAQVNNRKGLIVCLFLTLLGAVGFLVIKYFEYEHKIKQHLVWGPTFYVPPEPHGSAHDIAAAEAALRTLETAPATSVAIEVKDPTPFAIPQLAARPATDASAVKAAARGPGGVAATVRSPESAAAAEGPSPQEVAHPSLHLADPRMPPNTHVFFGIYYAMTGLHGIHVVVGMIVIVWLIKRAFRGDFHSEYFTPVDTGGLYWHIVDLIWIFLFPLFYLIH
jgi:cytochrome c oxidase subunit 3